MLKRVAARKRHKDLSEDTPMSKWKRREYKGIRERTQGYTAEPEATNRPFILRRLEVQSVDST